jgi:fatty acid desaturase
VVINPVGLRYHATHHLFPSMPYHNMRAAHKRLMAELPADSLYRRTVAHSMWEVIANLWRTAAMPRSPERIAYREQRARRGNSSQSPLTA